MCACACVHVCVCVHDSLEQVGVPLHEREHNGYIVACYVLCIGVH